MEPPPPRPAGHGASVDDADIGALPPTDDAWSSAHAVQAQLPDRTRLPQQEVDSSPADEDWEIPAHWQRPTARSDPAPKKGGRKGGDQSWSVSNAGWADSSWNEWQEGSNKWDEKKDWWNDGGWSTDSAGGANAATWLDGHADEGAIAQTPHVQQEASGGGEDSLAAVKPDAEEPLAEEPPAVVEPVAEEPLAEEPLAVNPPGRWRQNRLGIPEPPKPAAPPEPLENHLLEAGSQSSDANDGDYVDLGQEVCKSPQAPPPQKNQVAKPPPPVVVKPAPPDIARETTGPPGEVDEPKPKKDKAGTPKDKKKLLAVAKPPPADIVIPPTKTPPPESGKAASPISVWDMGRPPGEGGMCDDNVDAGKAVTKPAQAAAAVKEKDQAGTPKANKKNNAAKLAAVVAKPPPAAVVKPVPPVAAKPPPAAVAKPAPPVIPTPSAWETRGPPIVRPPPPPSPLDAPGEPAKSSVASPKVKAPPPMPKPAPVQDEVEVVLPIKDNKMEATQKASAKPKLGVKAKSAPKGANPLPQRSAAAAQAPKPTPVMLPGGDSRSATSSTQWLERPVEKLSETNAYYEEEDDPDLASYLWDRKAHSPKNDQTRVTPKSDQMRATPKLAAAAPSVLPKPAPVPDEAIPPATQHVLAIKAASTVAPARPKLGVKAKQPQAKGVNPLPQRSANAAQASKPAPVMVSGGLAAVSDSRNAASSQKWLERPVEKLSNANTYYEEEDDPDLAAYLWDRKAQRPKNDQMRVVPKRAAAAASQRIPAPSQQRQRALLTQVMEMGFDETSAAHALTATGWNTVEEALAAMCGS